MVAGSFVFVIMPSGIYKRTKENRENLSNALMGRKLSKEHSKKISESLIGKKRKPFTKKHRERIGNASRGRILSEETREKMSESRKGNKAYQWKGGVSRKYKTGYHSKEYKNWRKSVFERDNYTCQFCDTRGGYLEPHHIKKWSKYLNIRFEINNGITLCRPCHMLTMGKEIQFENICINKLLKREQTYGAEKNDRQKNISIRTSR